MRHKGEDPVPHHRAGVAWEAVGLQSGHDAPPVRGHALARPFLERAAIGSDAGFDTPESLADYPFWPRVERFDYDGATALAKRVSADYAVIGPWVSFFEIYCQMRGLENAMMDVAASSSPQMRKACRYPKWLPIFAARWPDSSCPRATSSH